MKHVQFAGLAALALLSGCAAIDTVGKAWTLSSIEADILGETETAAMPDSGTATYDGVALIGVTEGANTMGLVGDATINATFTGAGGTLDGTLDNFVAAGVDPQAIMDSPLSEVFTVHTADGTVAITGGAIAGNAFTADFAGALTADGTPITVNGTMDGTFYGTTAELLEAMASLGDGNMTATLDGVAADGATLYLVGRQ